MIAFLLLAVAFSKPVRLQAESEKAVGFGYTMCVQSGGRWTGERCIHAEEEDEEEVGKYFGPNCFAREMNTFPYKCHQAVECEWGTHCKESCGFKNLARDCSGVTVSTCVQMKKFLSQCLGYGCICDMTLQQCIKEGFTEDYCVEKGCDKEEEEVGMVNTSHDYGRRTYFGNNCFEKKFTSFPWKCHEAPECEWQSYDCKEECGYRTLSDDCSGVSITKCMEMGNREDECFKYKCTCDWTMTKCKEKGYSEEYCRDAGCVDDSETCTCDDRGRHPHQDGDWCYLASAPCTFLDGRKAGTDWTWADCEYKGKTQVDCGPESEKAVGFPDTMCIMSGGRWTGTRCVHADAENAVGLTLPTTVRFGECTAEEIADGCDSQPAGKGFFGKGGPALCACFDSESEKAVGFPDTMCIMSGGRWTGTRCVHAATESEVGQYSYSQQEMRCYRKGGKWEGTYCSFSSMEAKDVETSVGRKKRCNAEMDCPDAMICYNKVCMMPVHQLSETEEDVGILDLAAQHAGLLGNTQPQHAMNVLNGFGRPREEEGVAQAFADASTVAAKTSNDGPSFAVSALAVLGLGAMVYGAGRYYLSKE